MALLISYNNTNPFSGIATLPTVSKEDDMINFHNRWAVKNTLVLRGNITGNCSGGFSQLIDRQRSLINAFSEDHKPFAIQEDGVTLYTGQYTVVKSVNFPSNNYVRLLPYEITLENYPFNLFSGVYGIEQPQHTVDYSENSDGTIDVTRKISAKGFNTSESSKQNTSLNNAKAWVQSRTGWANMDAMGYPSFVTLTGGLNPCLKNFHESLNRMEGYYEVTEKYEFKNGCSGTNLLRYSTDIDYNDQEGLYNVSVEGDFNGCQGLTITGLRAVFTGINTYDLANNALQGIFPNAPELNTEWLSKSIEEDTNKKNINFRINYDTDYIPKVMFQKEFNVEYDVVEDTHNVSMRGVIKARGSQKERWERVFNFYNSQVNIFNLINTFYVSRGYPYVLNPYFISNQTSFDKFNGEITIDVTYNNRPLPPPGFISWDYTVTVEPALNLISYIPNLCQDYIVMDLRAAKRALATIDGEAIAISSSDLSSTIRTNIAALLSPYVVGTNIILKSDNVSRTFIEQGVAYQFNRSSSFNGTLYTP